ncbi:hypothetical protein J4475_00470 [Candidatus Woesearchaeota archaeon]|nr:hypothetical protein [Candidatus Woesearchaeota archaeon]
MLAPLVAGQLRGFGYDVQLVENPEKRTFLEIVLQARGDGRRILGKEVEELLYGWEDSLVGVHKNVQVFYFHNSNTNLTEFDAEWSAEAMVESLRSYFPHFDRLEPLKSDGLARKVYMDLYDDGFLTVEVPHIQIPRLPDDVRQAVRGVLHHRTFARYGSYLLDSDVGATAAQGWLGAEMAATVARGLDYLLKEG